MTKWGTSSGFPTTGHYDGRRDKPFLEFLNDARVKDACMILLRRSSEEVYDGCLIGIYV